MRHCPSADNPRTVENELDCFNVRAKNSIHKGQQGNKCQVDCANQGICDYTTGSCQCFDGYFGPACNTIDGHVRYSFWQNYNPSTQSGGGVASGDDDL
jgi:hypothetical protein